MKRQRPTPEQVLRKLREGDRLLNDGRTSPRCCATSRSRSRAGIAGELKYGGDS
jgi:hypothetical protein